MYGLWDSAQLSIDDVNPVNPKELNNNCACVRWTNEQSLNERQMERSIVSSPKRLYLYLLGEGSRSLNNIRGSSLLLVCLVCKLGG